MVPGRVMQIPILNGVQLAGMPEKYYVYEHLRNDSGAVFYVGKGKNRRAYVANRHHRSEWWLRVVEKCGGFSVRFIAIDISEEEAFEKEKQAIANYRAKGVSLVNMTDGGDGSAGAKRSEKWKALMSAVHKGKTIPLDVREKIAESVKSSGYIPSDEARAKMSAAHKGKKRSLGYRHSEEWKAAASEQRIGNKSRTGQKRSDEERAKSSASLSGRVQNKLTCPHCFKQGGNAMRRHHFDNCKEANNASGDT